MKTPTELPADAFALVYDPNEPTAGIQVWIPDSQDPDGELTQWAALMYAFGMRVQQPHEEAFRQELFNWLDRVIAKQKEEKPDAATAAFLDDVPHEQFDEPEDR